MKKQNNIEEVLKKEGHLIYPIVGRSMYPLLLVGDQVLLSVKDSYSLNDIVLFKNNGRNNSYVLHRIRKIENDKAYILGDNSLRLDIIPLNEILAKMDGLYRNSIYYDFNSELISTYEKNYIDNPKVDIDCLINNKETYLLKRFDDAVKEVSLLFIRDKKDIDISKLTKLNGEEMSKLIRFLHSKKALHLLGLILEELDISLTDSEKKLIEGEFNSSKLRYMRIIELEKELTNFFNAHHINFMFIKGSEVRSLYPNQYLRVSNDIDLYVSPKDFLLVRDLFIKDLKAKLLPAENKYHDGFIIDKYKLVVEVHKDLSYNLPDDLKPLLSDPFEKAIICEKSNQYRMNPEMYYLYHVLHSAKHTANGETWLTMFSDTYFINKSYNLSKEMIAKSRLENFEEVLNNITNHFFNNKELSNNEIDFLKFIYLDNYTRYISLNKGKQPSKTRFIISRIFVSKAFLISRYPSLKKHQWLMPIYQVRRWFSIFRKGKVSSSKKEIQSYSSSSDEAYKWLSNNGLNEYLNKKN